MEHRKKENGSRDLLNALGWSGVPQGQGKFEARAAKSDEAEW